MKLFKLYLRYILILMTLSTGTLASAADFVVTVPYDITNVSGYLWNKVSITCMVNSEQAVNTAFSGAAAPLYATGNKTFTPARSSTPGVFRGETTVDVNVLPGTNRDPAKEKAYYCVIAIIKLDGSVATNAEVNSRASTLRVKGTL